MSFVLDDSVALAWCFEDEPLEALNGLLAAERRKRLDRTRRHTLAKLLRELPVRIDAHTAEHAWDATAELAEEHALTLHDAAYLELALRRRLPLASLDQDLRQAAEAVGADVLGFS